MSTSHLALVRAEVKTWERDFTSRHGRDPSVQDIRDHPSIAEKYKLYKKLSRAAPTTTARLPTPKSHPAESVPPLLPRFNPFSPVKKFIKPNHSPPPQPSLNPFATPTKRKPLPCSRTVTPSPDPSPSTLLPHPSANVTRTTAVSRARKRLRGDPVSPSPSKPKRQRTRSHSKDSSSSDHEADRELLQCDFSSFVADSPVKAPAGGKAFKLLFDDALPTLSISKKPEVAPLVSRGRDAHLSQQPCANRSAPASIKHRHDLKSTDVTSRSEHRPNYIQAKLSTQIFPTKDNLPPPPHKPPFKPVASHVLRTGRSTKRLLDNSDLVPPQLQHPYPLIPPSPPPEESIGRDAGKGRVKSAASRKRPRAEDQDNDEGTDSPDDINLKITTVSLDRAKHPHADSVEWDPLLHLGTRNHDPGAEEQIDATHHASSTLYVDLPDKFRRVLAISPSRNRNSTEERVVRGLLYGDRVGHYDPSRGGDIWDAGEMDDGTLGDAETEDDWEGEPVPWEVGEL